MLFARKKVEETYDHVVTCPSKEWVQEAGEETRYTPDMWMLDESAWHNLFVYGTFQRGLRDHNWFLSPDKCHVPVRRCLAFTENTGLTLVKKNLSTKSFPIALTPTTELSSLKTGRIQGEVYSVRPKHFLQLDKYHENTVQFIRVRVNLTVPYRCITQRLSPNPMDNANLVVSSTVLTRGFKTLRAWMYMGVSSFWNPLIDAGYLYSPVRRYKHISKSIGDCFYYTMSENFDTWLPDQR